MNAKAKAIALAAATALLPSVAWAAADGIGGPVDPSIYRLMVFVMAIFVGYYVVWSVTPALHTPLMSVTNAISSIIAIGALVQLGPEGWIRWMAVAALALTAVNMFGGFAVTQRMLQMFQK